MLRALISRREAIKTIFWTSVAVKAAGSRLNGLAAGELSAAQGDFVGTLKLSRADFPALEQPFGSVRVGTSPIGEKYPLGVYYPLIITRGPVGEFYALKADCTHEGCTVRAFDTQEGLMACPCHGSRYAIDGTVVQGPASFPLLRYEIEASAKDILVKIPEIFLQAEITKLLQGTSPRIALNFLTFSNIQYEIHYLSAMGEKEEVVPFALNESGPFDRMVWNGNDDFAIVYVPVRGRGGIYQAAMKVKPV